MKAREKLHQMQSDPNYSKSRYFSEQLAVALLNMQDYEMREIVAKLKSVDWDWDLDKFIEHMDTAPELARVKLLFTKLMEVTCCPNHFVVSLIAAIMVYRMDVVLGKDPNVSLH